MKKTIVFLVFTLVTSLLLAQNHKGKAEVLYFKANLACCKAKACNMLEGEIKAIVEKNYPKGNVVFKEIKLAEEANKPLVEKYNAVSQTVIIVAKKKKKEKFINVSDVVKQYQQNQNKEQFEKELIAKIDELIK